MPAPSRAYTGWDSTRLQQDLATSSPGVEFQTPAIATEITGLAQLGVLSVYYQLGNTEFDVSISVLCGGSGESETTKAGDILAVFCCKGLTFVTTLQIMRRAGLF